MKYTMAETLEALASEDFVTVGQDSTMQPSSSCRLHRSDTGPTDATGEVLENHMTIFAPPSPPYWTLPQAGERSLYTSQLGYTFPGDEHLLRSGIGFENAGRDAGSDRDERRTPVQTDKKLTMPEAPPADRHPEQKMRKKQGKTHGHFKNGKFVRDDAAALAEPGSLQRGWIYATGGRKLSRIVARCKIAPGILCFYIVARSKDTPADVVVACLLILIGSILLLTSEAWIEKAIDDGKLTC